MKFLITAFLIVAAASAVGREPLPIIDMHHHAAWPGIDDAAALESTLDLMDRHGIVLSSLYLTEPGDVSAWVAAAPDRFAAGPMFPCAPFDAERTRDCFRASDGWPEPKWVEQGLASGKLRLLGEMLFVYHGTAPNDPQLEPYWSLAAKYDVPVIVHAGRGPPSGAPPRYDGCCPNFNSEYGNPALLRNVLERYPTLRVQLAHIGAPSSPDSEVRGYLDEAIALMREHPNVYVDMSIINSIGDERTHARALKRLIASGLLGRIMFGSDNRPVEPILERLDRFTFLSDAQRRDILYNNASRFLRLSEATIARHHQLWTN